MGLTEALRGIPPAEFLSHFFAVTPTRTQTEILNAIRDHDRVAVKSSPGIGKTWAAAMAVVWFFISFAPCKIITTAPTHRQVTNLLWSAIGNIIARSRVPLGFTKLKNELRVPGAPEWYAIGFSPGDDQNKLRQRFQGFHSENIFVVVDEANGIPESIYDSIDMILTTPNSKLLLIGNPIRPQGRFYQAFLEPGWKTLTFSVRDIERDAQWLPSQDWVQDKENRWGPDSPMYHSLVLAEFPQESEDQLIPLWWIEHAIERWRSQQGSSDEATILGIDPSDQGDDATGLVWRRGARVLSTRLIRAKSETHTMEIAGLIAEEARKGVRVAIDSVGIGAPIYARCREQGIQIAPVNFGSSVKEKDSSGTMEFANLRSCCWWRLREALDPEGENPLALPPDESLIADLSAPRWSRTSSGKIKIETKESIRSRLGRSPDLGDALSITFSPNTSPFASADPDLVQSQALLAPRWGTSLTRTLDRSSSSLISGRIRGNPELQGIPGA